MAPGDAPRQIDQLPDEQRRTSLSKAEVIGKFSIMEGGQLVLRSWRLMYGNSDVLLERFLVHTSRTYEEELSYLAGAPGGVGGSVARNYAALWQRLERDPRPVAKKSWSELSPQTRRGYTGPMHKVFGVPRNAAAEAAFYAQANADELAILRRHPRPGTIIVKHQAFRLLSAGVAAWATTWQATSRAGE